MARQFILVPTCSAGNVIERTSELPRSWPTFRRLLVEFLRNFFCIVYNRLAFTGRFGINEVLGFFLPGS